MDIKSLEPTIFKDYTGVEAVSLHNRLKTLYDMVGADNVTIKIPLIPDFNAERDVARSKERIRAMGFKNIEKVRYFKSLKEGSI